MWHHHYPALISACTCVVYALSLCPVAATLGFDGTQYMAIPLPQESRTEAEDISLRFRTERPNGLLFATMSNTTLDRLELMLDDGEIRFDVNLGSGTKVSQRCTHVYTDVAS